MDPVTQGALGAACSQALLYKYDKRNAWIVGALGGMAADLDLVIHSSSNPMLSLIYHRQFTHSLAFIPIGGVLVALVLFLFKRFRVHWRFTLLASLIGYATHALLDACTSYGTVLFWPFSNQRVAWDFISIIDPYFTLPLIWGVIWTQIFANRKAVLLGLSAAGLVLLFNIGQNYRALEAVTSFSKKHHIQLNNVRAFPNLASSTHWKIAAFANNNKIMLANVYTPIFSSSKMSQPKFYSAFNRRDLPVEISSWGHQLHDFEVFNWFADGYLIAAKKHPLILIDARYLTDEPLKALWGIQFDPDAVHVKNVSNVVLSREKK